VKAIGAPPLIALAAIALLLSAGCASRRVTASDPSRVQVVLLEDPENPASAVNVTTKSGDVVLAKPLESTTVRSNQPPSPPVKMDEAEVRREFGAVLADLPAAPLHFNLYFRTDTSELTDESRAILADVLSAAKARKVPEVTVIGHTDTTGSAANNYRLGLERAEAVRGLLRKAGLDASMIEVESHGEADPVRKTPDNTAEPRNRRVEITIR
jgi:outer membrane protein OmpA-like peptidoglycan-associated protein